MKPHIPLPCSEDWNKMKIGQISRHCDSCRKNVMDFTKMSRHEILAYLIENRNKQVCGHIYESQLDFRHEEIMVTIRDLEKKHRNTNLSYYLLTMATLTLMSCETQPSKPVKPNTELTSTPQTPSDTKTPASAEKPIMGKAVCTPVVGEMAIEDLPATAKGGMAIQVPEPPRTTNRMEIIMGDIAYDYPEARITAEVMPEFNGGTDSLIAYIQRHLNYPKWEKKNKIEGTVYATFVIDPMGQIINPQILRSVEGSKNFDGEVINLLVHMPKWKPGKEKGENIAVKFNLPFHFKL